MRKLALTDEVLLSVEKPARYIGGEVNMVVKDPNDVWDKSDKSSRRHAPHILITSFQP